MTPTTTRDAKAETTKAGRNTIAIAWAATLALSSLPEIILVETVGMSRAPMRWIWLALAASLILVAGTWRPARLLRGYFTVLLGIITAIYFLVPMLSGWAVPEGGSEITRAVWHKTIFFAVALGMAAFLVVVLGRTAKETFLTPGNLTAPTTLRLPGMHRPFNWAVVGAGATVLLFAGFASQMWLDSAFPPDTFRRLLPLAPLVVVAAAFNAFGEEVVFRAGPLAWLHRVVGPNQAVLMTSVWFGLGHYFTTVNAGLVGVVESGTLALLMGKAMVETKGLGWPWVIHFAIDLVIFVSIAVLAI